MHALNELKSTNNSIEGRLKQLNCEIGERKGKCMKKHFIIYMRYNLTKRVIQTFHIVIVVLLIVGIYSCVKLGKAIFIYIYIYILCFI